ncbi:ATP synthase subunit I [Litorivivens sp.]|uniref:ATP synthase subunit I n=1 Tax=Litorivivens sp. TaxID=2020868 RepID=UPI003566AAE9
MARQGGNPPQAAAISRPPLVKIYGLQAGLLVLASAGVMLVDVASAKALLIGGLISVLPNAYFARMAFRHRGSRAASEVSSAFKRGEAGKFVLTVSLFAIVFSTVPDLRVEALFAGFIGMMLVNLFFAWKVSNFRSGR